MVAKEAVRRPVGRPRTYDDDEVFRATSSVLAKNGFANLTLSAVASELGCTAPALNNRFGSKGELLFAFLEWSNRQAEERFARARRMSDSPLTVLRARFSMPVSDRRDEVASAHDQVNRETLALAAAKDPELRPILNRRREIFEEQICALLNEAVAAGEIVPCDTSRLAWLMVASLSGMAHLMALGHPGPTMEDQLGAIVDEVIRPYRVNASTEGTRAEASTNV